MCVEDEGKHKFVIEQFYSNEDSKWRFLTVPPSELLDNEFIINSFN